MFSCQGWSCRTSKHAVGDPPGERLRRLLEQGRGRTPEHQERSGAAGPIGQDPEHRKEVRTSLDLVEDDQAARGLQREHG
jgi:hypothetical protein